MNGYKPGLLSVCCLGYNHAKFAADCINAIFACRYPDIEIIVLDDGSKDDSFEVLNEIKRRSKFPIELIFQENTGNIGYNLNKMIRSARGEFISFMALDDVWITRAVEKNIEYMLSSENNVFIASSKITAIDDVGNPCFEDAPKAGLSLIANPSIDDLLRFEYAEFGSFFLQGVIFRREVIDAVNGFDEDMLGDDIVLRTKVFFYVKAHPCYNFKIVSYPTCLYRRHGSNISKNGARQLKIVAQYLERYWPGRKNPKLLTKWMLWGMKNCSYKDVYKLIFYNRRTKRLLFDPKIIIALIKRSTRFVYHKQTIGQHRVITLFMCWSITYRKR